MSAGLDALRARCEAALAAALPPDTGTGALAAAMRYAVLGGGKRLRPLLVHGAGAALGVAPALLDPAAVAVELVHAYSLVHDDLPAMDDDDLRRGRPTVHRAFDEATAILAGDALQALAFQALAGGAAAGLAPARVQDQVAELACAAGAAGMVGGQALDLAVVGTQPDLATLTRMHGLKTGALIAACVRLAALASGRDDAATAALDRYAADLGLAFQIQDDVLDEIGDAAVTGKAVGADRARGKPTFTAHLGVAGAQARAGELLDRALAALGEVDGDTDVLARVAQALVQRRA
jgi:farnesyl diphosphate synthase/geranylgeranyl diphosphate synthase type II